MTEVWQVATRDTAPEWFDLKADALERVHVLVAAGKVPVCVAVPVWGGTRATEQGLGAPRGSKWAAGATATLEGRENDNRGIQEREQ